MLRTRALVIAIVAGLVLCLFSASGVVAADDTPTPPQVGDSAPDFELESLAGEHVSLEQVREQGPVVLVVLRGFPGYQCPICGVQVANLRKHQDKFAAAGVNVLLVYPGPSDELRARADEFLRGKALPDGFHLLLDPDYTFTDAYGLRWDAPRETAYPSAFVIDGEGTVRFGKVSKTHGGRATAPDILDALP